MCGPAIAALTTAVKGATAATSFATSLAVSGITTGMSFLAAQQQANAQNDAMQANINATAAAANQNLVQQSTDLHHREQQEKAAAALRLHNARVDTDKAAGTAAAINQGEGLSYQGLIGDYENQYTAYADAEMQQLGFSLDQVQRTREGIEASAQSSVNSLPTTPIQGPSILAAAAGVGASALSAYDKYSVRDPFTGERTLT